MEWIKKSRMLVRRRKRNWRRLLRRKRGTRLLSYFSQKITRKLHGKLHGIKQKLKPAETILLIFLFPTFTAAGFVRSFNLQIEGKLKTPVLAERAESYYYCMTSTACKQGHVTIRFLAQAFLPVFIHVVSV